MLRTGIMYTLPAGDDPIKRLGPALEAYLRKTGKAPDWGQMNPADLPAEQVTGNGQGSPLVLSPAEYVNKSVVYLGNREGIVE